MKNIFTVLVLLFGLNHAFAQRNTTFKHEVGVDVMDAINTSLDLHYIYYDTPKRAIAANFIANFSHNDVPLSGVISRRYYLSEDRWAAYVAPYTSFMQTRGSYLADIITEEDDNSEVIKQESRYHSESFNVGFAIGYTYVEYNGFSAGVEFGYGVALWHYVDWASEPSEGTEKSIKSTVPLLFNLSIGYAF